MGTGGEALGSERSARFHVPGMAGVVPLAAAVALALVLVPTPATAAFQHQVTADIDTGGGVHLANRQGGFYMGRLLKTNRFDRTPYDGDADGIYTSPAPPTGNGSDYVWGYSVDKGQNCFWLGPAQHHANRSWLSYLNISVTIAPDQCRDNQGPIPGGRRKHLNQASNIGSHFNCTSGESAGPAWTRLTSSASFFYNVRWEIRDTTADGLNNPKYHAVSGQDPAGTLTAWQAVQYRYTTNDGNWSVIFVPGKGWGFVPANSVPHVSGYWGYENETHKHALCGQPPRSSDGKKPLPSPPMQSSDWSGDGRTDVIARRPDGTLSMYRGDGAGSFSGGEVQFNWGWEIFQGLLNPGDFSGDGKSDILATKSDGTLWLYRGNGAGGFVSGGTQIGSGWHVYDMLVAGLDFSGDAEPDLVVRRSDGTLWMYRGNGSGGFVTGNADQIGDGWNAFDAVIAARDFSGDGRADLIARKPDGTLWLYEGDGDWGFRDGNGRQIGDGFGTNRFNFLFGGVDFSGDGKADLIARQLDGTLWRFRGNGSGGFIDGNGEYFNAGWNIFDRLMLIA